MIKETFYTMNSPISIALITDTHNHPADQVIRSLERNKTDIICIAGDFVYARLPEECLKMEESDHAVEFLKECNKLAPTFVSLGNHEWMINDRDVEIIKSTGVTLLHNDYVHLHCPCSNISRSKDVPDILIGGLTSASYMAYRAYCASLTDENLNSNNNDNVNESETGSEIRPESATIYPLLKPRSAVIRDYKPENNWLSWLDHFCQEEGYKILLCHHPEYYPLYLKNRQIELVLSGHAHGGQIRIMGKGLYAPGQGLFPKLTSGIVDQRLVISRGLANNTLIPRLWNPEEIIYIY